ADEFLERLDRGEQPDVEEYARRHPEVADAFRHLLPALHALRASPEMPGPEVPEGPGGTEQSLAISANALLGDPVLLSYLRAVAGQSLDFQRWTEHHPDLAANLEQFLGNQPQLATGLVPPTPPPQSPWKGGRVGPGGAYEILKEVGRGG